MYFSVICCTIDYKVCRGFLCWFMANYTVSTQIHSSRKEMSWLFSNREWDLGYYPLLENDSRNSGIIIIIFTKFAFPVMTNRFEELFHMKASLY